MYRPHDSHASETGLLSVDGRSLKTLKIGLRSVDVKAQVRDLISSKVVEQHYTNEGDKPVEVKYVFPADPEEVTHRVTVKIGDRVIVTTVKEKEEAKKEYDTAVQAKKTAIKVDHESADTRVLTLGNFPPKSELIVRLESDVVLSMNGAEVRFVLPTVVSEKYDPYAARTQSFSTHAANVSDRVDAKDLEYRLTMELDIQMPSTITKVRSPSHGIEATMLGQNRQRVRFGQKDVALEKDVEVFIEQEKPFENRAAVEWNAERKTVAIQAAFCPELIPSEKMAAEPASEIVFLVDCSGSMEPNVAAMKSCVLKILKSLHSRHRFNVYCFGDSYRALWPESKPYTDETLAEALKAAEKLSANMNGTELLPPLAKILESALIPEFPRQVAIITDGGITNTDEVIRLVRKHAATTRIFTFGLGNNVSKDLVESLARVGGGESEFISNSDTVSAQVMRQMARMDQPAFLDVKIDPLSITGASDAKDVPVVKFYPENSRAMFAGGRYVVYAIAPITTVAAERLRSIRVSLRRSDQPAGAAATVVTVPITGAVTVGGTIHRLAANKGIQEWLDRNATTENLKEVAGKAEITKLSIDYQIPCRLTSFIGVDSTNAVASVHTETFTVPLASDGMRSGGGAPPMALFSMNYVPHSLSIPMPVAMAAAASAPFSHAEQLQSVRGLLPRKHGLGLQRRLRPQAHYSLDELEEAVIGHCAMDGDVDKGAPASPVKRSVKFKAATKGGGGDSDAEMEMEMEESDEKERERPLVKKVAQAQLIKKQKAMEEMEEMEDHSSSLSLDEVIRLQSASGAWISKSCPNLIARLLGLLSAAHRPVVEKYMKDCLDAIKANEDLALTHIVRYVLRAVWAHRIDEWRILDGKANRWCGSRWKTVDDPLRRALAVA
jgi:hypothetical protein